MTFGVEVRELGRDGLLQEVESRGVMGNADAEDNELMATVMAHDFCNVADLMPEVRKKALWLHVDHWLESVLPYFLNGSGCAFSFSFKTDVLSLTVAKSYDAMWPHAKDAPFRPDWADDSCAVVVATFFDTAKVESGQRDTVSWTLDYIEAVVKEIAAHFGVRTAINDRMPSRVSIGCVRKQTVTGVDPAVPGGDFSAAHVARVPTSAIPLHMIIERDTGVTLRKARMLKYLGHYGDCPFCKANAFVVGNNRRWRCWKCGENGNRAAWFVRWHGMSRFQAEHVAGE